MRERQGEKEGEKLTMLIADAAHPNAAGATPITIEPRPITSRNTAATMVLTYPSAVGTRFSPAPNAETAKPPTQAAIRSTSVTTAYITLHPTESTPGTSPTTAPTIAVSIA